MRAIFITSLFSILCFCAAAQNVAINTNAAPPDASAILDVQSTTKGVVFPRMLESERTAIVAPAKGLVVYQTDGVQGYYYNAGTDLAPLWTKMSTDKSTVAFSVKATATQNVPPNAYTKLIFSTEDYDESGNFVTGTASEFTATSAGIYHFDASVVFGTAPVRYDLAFFVNGVQKKNVLTLNNAQYINLQLSADFKLDVNDKVDVRLYGTGGPATVLASSPEWNWFSGHKVN